MKRRGGGGKGGSGGAWKRRRGGGGGGGGGEETVTVALSPSIERRISGPIPSGMLVARRVFPAPAAAAAGVPGPAAPGFRQGPAPGAPGGMTHSERQSLLLRVLERAQEKLTADLVVEVENGNGDVGGPGGQRGRAERLGSPLKGAEAPPSPPLGAGAGDGEEYLRKLGSFEFRLYQMEKLKQVNGAIQLLKDRMANEAEAGQAAAQLAALRRAPPPGPVPA